ncbi:amidohydrolase family protein [Parasporobacterium paucivorans]|uniref:Amidohydrolase family protein n=1 Tax=Parasporobacterium paucivorans DSM 15970 TaxID=1122934 RepID=A0A1M6JI65_9FIRM|nr:amidohydrolase family protein [Parasporobacterium paucivorans]SHJ46391.1 Amidohydrolase family protein [Parasporobacterium paucivorans DSM 15970]
MFTDMHIHAALNHLFTRKQWGEADEEQRIKWLQKFFAEYEEMGISALRDGGDSAFISFEARPVARERGFVYKTPVYALYKKGCYGSFIGMPVADLTEIKEELIRLSSYEPDHIKVILTGIVDFQKYGHVGGTNFSLRELSYICDFARDRGLPVMVHANGSEGVNLAIEAGISTLEHGYLVSEAELYKLAEARVTWVPTLSPLGNILESADQRFDSDKEVIRKVFGEQLANIQKADSLGVKIALGSDAGALLVGHGTGLEDEMRHFEKIDGFSRNRIERICTDQKAWMC